MTVPLDSEHDIATRASLGDIARVFFKLGTTAFGGPAAHIAMMEQEVVRRRKWITHERFLDYVGATNLIPGPNSTELAIHIGHAMAGWPGLLVAGACFIVPAAAIVAAIAWAYVRFGSLPQVAGVMYGIKPVVIAVVLQAIYNLGRVALKTRWLAALAAASVAAAALGVNELVVLLAAGALAAATVVRARVDARAALIALVGAQAAPAFGLWPLFLVFAKVGAVLFGSGYVLLAFLRADLVDRLHWLTDKQLVDAIAVGQITPGPVFTTSTFVGYVLAGGRGAAVATIGIFLPAFFFVAVSGPLVPRLRRSPVAGAVLDGVNVASLALMTLVTVQLARTALVDWLAVAIAATAAVLLVAGRLNSTLLLAGGAIVGAVAR